MKLCARAIIVSKNQILLVRHKNRDFYALPGGKLNDNEDIRTAMERELFEELGVKANVGNLLFVHEFRYPKGTLSLEFFFWITNAADFVDKDLNGEFAEQELAEITWKHLDDEFDIKPPFLQHKLTALSSESRLEYYSELQQQKNA